MHSFLDLKRTASSVPSVSKSHLSILAHYNNNITWPGVSSVFVQWPLRLRLPLKKWVVIFKLKLSSSVLFDYRGPSSSSYVSWRAQRIWLWDGNPLICSGGSNNDNMFFHLWFQTTALQFHLIKLKHLLTSYYFHPPVHSSSHTLLWCFSLQQAAVLFLSCGHTKAHVRTRINVHMWEMCQGIFSSESF